MRVFLIPFQYSTTLPNAANSNSSTVIDEFLYKKYGMKCVDDTFVYEITDENKFIMFCIKFNQVIFKRYL